MSSCRCRPDSLTRVTFGNGTELLRCPAHEAQRWLVDGSPVAAPVALDGLRSLFVERRGAAVERPARSGQPARTKRVIRLPQDAPAEPGRVDDAALTALLNARGLSGSWAIA